MRFVSGQAILELKETQGKTTSVKWRLPSLINSHSWEDYAFHLGKKTAFLPPGHSCKEIRNASSHLKDGEYWIALKKNGSLLKVYCDMTTDGGKEWMFKKN